MFADRPGAWMTVGEMPGVTVEHAREFTDPCTAELDMVFQFEHVGLDHDGDKYPARRPPVRPPRLRDLRALAGGALGGRLEQPVLEQPRPAAGCVPIRRRRAYWYESATVLATVLHLHRGTPYVYQGEEIGMTNVRSDRFDDFRTSSRSTTTPSSVGPAPSPDDVARCDAISRGRDNARTPMQWDRRRRSRVHRRHGVDGRQSRTMSGSTPKASTTIRRRS